MLWLRPWASSFYKSSFFSNVKIYWLLCLKCLNFHAKSLSCIAKSLSCIIMKCTLKRYTIRIERHIWKERANSPHFSFLDQPIPPLWVNFVGQRKMNQPSYCILHMFWSLCPRELKSKYDMAWTAGCRCMLWTKYQILAMSCGVLISKSAKTSWKEDLTI